MGFMGIVAVVLYVTIAVFALYMTHQERRWNAQVTPRNAAFGYVLCLFWPVMIVGMALTLLVQRLRPEDKVAGKTG